MARAEPFDLILCDVHLPKRDGYELARQLKADHELRKVPLVAVTALALLGDREKILGAGFNGYITKPINPETFVREIETYLAPAKRGWTTPEGGRPGCSGTRGIGANGKDPRRG